MTEPVTVGSGTLHLQRTRSAGGSSIKGATEMIPTTQGYSFPRDQNREQPVAPPLTEQSRPASTYPTKESSRIASGTGWLKAAMVCSDLLTFLIAALWAIPTLDINAAVEPLRVLGVVTTSVVILFLAFSQQGLYNSRHLSRRAEEIRRLVNATALGSVGIAAVLLMNDPESPRWWIVWFAPMALILSALGREVLRRVIRHLRSTGRLSRRVILVGSNSEAEELLGMLSDAPELGYHVVGRVSDEYGTNLEHVHEPTTPRRPAELPTESDHSSTAPWMGTTHDILHIVRENQATGVVVATTGIDLDTANRLVRTLTNEGIYVEMSSAMRDIASRRVTIRPLGRYPIMTVEPVERSGWRAKLKRIFDVVMSCVVLLVLSPILLASMLAIRLSSGKGVFFRQTRVGLRGKEFTVFKLRTMVHNAEDMLDDLWAQNEASGPMFKMTHDPRVTKVGRILRRTSLDEVPQFFNVIKGEMSLVGPRPALPSEAEQWDEDLRERLRVKPGITGNWQVNGRFTASLEDYQRLDMYYVDNWSIVTDLVILAKTIPAVLMRNGAA